MRDASTVFNFTCAVVGSFVGIWAGLTPVIQLFLISIAFDIITGVLASLKNGIRLDSSISGPGLLMKLGELSAVAFLTIVGANPLINLPLGEIAAGALFAHETLSIVENLAAVNVKIREIAGPLLNRFSPPTGS
jgi:toxin secretion/phage lysis holin